MEVVEGQSEDETASSAAVVEYGEVWAREKHSTAAAQ